MLLPLPKFDKKITLSFFVHPPYNVCSLPINIPLCPLECSANYKQQKSDQQQNKLVFSKVGNNNKMTNDAGYAEHKGDSP